MPYLDNEYYHVYNRGAHKQPLFFTEDHYRYCTRLWNVNALEQHVSILCYCLMPNHYHLMLRQEPNGSISKFLQHSFNSYTQAINKETGHRGTLFEGRPKGILLSSDKYLLHLTRYIHYNPVSAGLVSMPEDWEFSDYRLWIYSANIKHASITLRDTYFKDGSEYKKFVDGYSNDKPPAYFKGYIPRE